MRKFLRISLLSLALVLSGVFGVENAQAQTIPPRDGPDVSAQQIRAIGTFCAEGDGAVLRPGAFGERGTGTLDQCAFENTTHRITCTYNSVGGRYEDATLCTVIYKEMPPPDNARVFDITAIGTVDQATTTQQEADNSTNANPGINGESCGINVGCHLAKLPGMLMVAIAFLLLTLAGTILAVVGTVFNWVVIRTVFQFGEYFGTSESMLIAWGVMRDIANIGLLFGFILMGVLLILNVDGGGHGHGGGISAKKAIPRLIIFAVLLNFSLFTTQFVIDVANAFGSSFVTLAGEECSTQTTSGTDASGGQELSECANYGISGRILHVTGLTSLWDTEHLDVEAMMQNLQRPYSYAVSLIMLSLFVLVTALVLLAGALMLIFRTIVLSLLMVTSPIGFAGLAIPKLEKIAGDWWSKLLSQAFFAPVYLLMIFISIKLTEGLMQGNATLANAVIANAGNSVAGNMQVVMVFLIVIGFMIASLITASKMGATGAKFATQSAAALTVGSVGFVGRRTAGVASEAAAKRVASSSWARNNGFGSRTAYNILNKGATSSFSLRSGISPVTKGLGVDVGKASKKVSHGIHGIVEEEVKARKTFAEKALAQNATEKAQEKALKDEKEKLKYYKDAAQEQAARDKEADEVPIKAQERLNKEQSEARSEAIEAKKRGIAALVAAGGGGDALAREKAALDALEQEHVQASAIEAADIAARKQILEERQARYQQTIKGYDTRSKQIDREINGYEDFDPATQKIVWRPGVSKESVQRRYGEALGSQHGLGWPSVGHHVNEEASAEIIKKLKKSKRDKLIDALKENAKDEEKEEAHEKKDAGGGHGEEKKGGGGGGGGHH